MMIEFKQNPFEFKYSDLNCETKQSGRTYETPDGDVYPSITTVLSILGKDAIEEWRNRIGHEKADKISRQAAWRGTQTHEAAEMRCMNIDPTISNPLIQYLYKQIEFVLEDRLSEVNALEKALYSNYLKVAGRVDLIGVFDGKLSVIDFKTSAKPKPKDFIENYFMQEAFYAIAWEEQTGQPINQLVTIIANEQGPSAQVFIEKRTAWQGKLIDTIKEWKRFHAL